MLKCFSINADLVIFLIIFLFITAMYSLFRLQLQLLLLMRML